MNSILIITKYLKYLIFSKNLHSIQSPFLFKYVKLVIYSKRIKNKEIAALRKKLSKDNSKIEITDYGAGSSLSTSKIRTIKDIAKNSAKNSKYGNLLYRMVQYSKPKNIIELGTSLGISTSYLAKGNTKGNVYTFEGCPATSNIAKNNFQNLTIDNINLTIGDFDLTLEKKLQEIQSVDFVFVDGNHQKDPTIDYFEKCLNHANNNTIFVFDDIHWSKEMEYAWSIIKNNSKTTVTIDLFFLGIVFIRKELSKEHFIIRF